MTIQPEHRALIFVGAIAVLGAGVRVARAVGSRPSAESQPALEHQMQAADSAAKASQRRRASREEGRASDQLAGGRSGDTGSTVRRGAHAPSRRPTRRGTRDSAAINPGAPLDRTGYVDGRLDLDVATAAQIDSLPGVPAAMAKRIVTDRMRRGPFLNANGLRRVAGVGPRFLAQIDSLVTFSGTYRESSSTDTIVPPRAKTRRPRPPPDR